MFLIYLFIIIIILNLCIFFKAKEARRLKEFLEDYDDEKDDPKYFKLVLMSYKFLIFPDTLVDEYKL